MQDVGGNSTGLRAPWDMPLALPPHAGGSAPPRPTALPSKNGHRPGRPALPGRRNPPWWPATLSSWHAWQGVSGLYYARRLRTSPPLVLRCAGKGHLIVRASRAEDRLSRGAYWEPLAGGSRG